MLEAFQETTPGCRVLFIPDPGDSAERRMIADVGADELVAEGNYAAKIRAGVGASDEPLVLTAADDVEPHPGWFERAIVAMSAPGVQAVGINDLRERQREHATHFLMAREYAQTPIIDGDPGPFCERYHHWAVDDEFIATARFRGVYAYAADSVIEHHHYMDGKSPDDETYRVGRDRAHLDLRLLRGRSHLWGE